MESSSIARLMEDAAPGSIGACTAKTAKAVEAEGVDQAERTDFCDITTLGRHHNGNSDPELVPTVDVLLGVDGEMESVKDGGQADSFVALLNEDGGRSVGGTNPGA